MKRTILLICLLLAIVAFAFSMWRRVAERATPKVFPLSNGTVLVYMGGTFGTNHYAPGSSARWLEFVPKFLRRMIPGGGVSTSTDFPQTVLWFNRLGTANYSD